MSEKDLKALSEQQLFDRFVALSVEMGEVYGSSTRLYTRYMNQREDVVAEIDGRGLDLASFFRLALHHENPWVRFAATRFCFDAAREETLAVLNQLAGMIYHHLGPIAGMALSSYAAGHRHTKKVYRSDKQE
jgi:hypothetical protein